MGIACRFKGLDWVVALINGGAKFYHTNRLGLSSFSELSGKYCCGYRGAAKFYDPEYSLMLLDHYEFARPYFGFYDQHIDYKHENGDKYSPANDAVLIFEDKEYPMIPLSERIEIAKWLAKNAANSRVFDSGKFLFNAILTESTEMVAALTEIGVKLSDEKRNLIVNCDDKSEWTVWQDILKSASADQLLSVLSGLSAQIGDEKILITPGMFSEGSCRFWMKR